MKLVKNSSPVIYNSLPNLYHWLRQNISRQPKNGCPFFLNPMLKHLCQFLTGGGIFSSYEIDKLRTLPPKCMKSGNLLNRKFHL